MLQAKDLITLILSDNKTIKYSTNVGKKIWWNFVSFFPTSYRVLYGNIKINDLQFLTPSSYIQTKQDVNIVLSYSYCAFILKENENIYRNRFDMHITPLNSIKNNITVTTQAQQTLSNIKLLFPKTGSASQPSSEGNLEDTV